MWILFKVPCPTPDGRSARDLYEYRVTRIDDAMRASARRHGCRFHRAWYSDDDSTFYALAYWQTREGAHAFFEEWDIQDEPGETYVELKGDVGLVPLP
jgi:hypothetical protein